MGPAKGRGSEGTHGDPSAVYGSRCLPARARPFRDVRLLRASRRRATGRGHPGRRAGEGRRRPRPRRGRAPAPRRPSRPRAPRARSRGGGRRRGLAGRSRCAPGRPPRPPRRLGPGREGLPRGRGRSHRDPALGSRLLLGERHRRWRKPRPRLGGRADADADGARPRSRRRARDRARRVGRRGPAPPRVAGAPRLRERDVRAGGLPRHGLAAERFGGSRGSRAGRSRPRLALQGRPRDRHGHGVPLVLLGQHDRDDELHRDPRREHQRHVRAGPEPEARHRDDVPQDGLGPVEPARVRRERRPAERVRGLLERELPEVVVSAVLRGPVLGQEHVGPLGHRVGRELRLRGRHRLQRRPDLVPRELAVGRHAHRRPRDRPQHGLAAHALLREPGARSLLRGRVVLHRAHVLSRGADDQRDDERDGHDHGLLPSPRRLQLLARLPPEHGQPLRRARARRGRLGRVHRPRRPASSSSSSRFRRDEVQRGRRPAGSSTRATRRGRSAGRRSARAACARSSRTEAATSRPEPSRSPRTSRP